MAASKRAPHASTSAYPVPFRDTWRVGRGRLLFFYRKRVSKHSRRSVRNLLAAVPPLAHSAAVPIVYRNLNIHLLTVHPRGALHRYQSLMAKCLASGNLQAHYVQGIKQYFRYNNVDAGLPHLKFAAEGSYDNTVYLITFMV
ncbi:hypothetical protein YC2023_025273 [Brassica napus]